MSINLSEKDRELTMQAFSDLVSAEAARNKWKLRSVESKPGGVVATIGRGAANRAVCISDVEMRLNPSLLSMFDLVRSRTKNAIR